MPGYAEKPPRFRTGEIVVAVPDQELVLRELDDIAGSATPRIVRSDRRLGLSLIGVTHSEPDEPAALDRMLAAVRASCAARYDGWVPTVGKNRLLDRIDGAGHVDGGGIDGVAHADGGGVSGAGHVDGGGGGLPEPAKGDEVPPALDPKRGRGVRVAELDTRIYPHVDLAGRYETEGPETLLRDPDGVPYHAGHATFVAGLITQRAPRVVIDVHNALNDNSEATAWDVARKMVEFADAGAGVLNLSMGCFTDDGQPPLLFQRAVDLLTPDVVIIAAAGNHGAGDSTYNVGPRMPFWPAALDDVVAVGAHDSDGRRATFSPDTPWVTLSARGVDVVSTFLKGDLVVPTEAGATTRREYGGYASWSGTSFAAALVTGEIAARTIPGQYGPRQALNDLLKQSQGQPGVDIWAYDHQK
jgi:membrane-anchored mycosin MYCP